MSRGIGDREIGGRRLEAIQVEEKTNSINALGLEHRENFDFEVWAAAVKQQLLAALHKSS
jgi:hypothetical protein